MTESEIIKSLQVCVNYSSCDECEYNLLRTQPSLCTESLHKDVLNLIKQKNAELDMSRAELVNYKAWYFSTVNALEISRKKNEILSRNADTAFQDGLNEAEDLYANRVKTEILKTLFDKCFHEAEVVSGRSVVTIESLSKIIKAMEEII